MQLPAPGQGLWVSGAGGVPSPIPAPAWHVAFMCMRGCLCAPGQKESRFPAVLLRFSRYLTVLPWCSPPSGCSPRSSSMACGRPAERCGTWGQGLLGCLQPTMGYLNGCGCSSCSEHSVLAPSLGSNALWSTSPSAPRVISCRLTLRADRRHGEYKRHEEDHTGTALWRLRWVVGVLMKWAWDAFEPGSTCGTEPCAFLGMLCACTHSLLKPASSKPYHHLLPLPLPRPQTRATRRT